MSQFAFLQRGWPSVYEAAPRALELAMAWVFKHDASLKLPYEDNLSALIHDPGFKRPRARPSSPRPG